MRDTATFGLEQTVEDTSKPTAISEEFFDVFLTPI
jgi:hypothetical protein